MTFDGGLLIDIYDRVQLAQYHSAEYVEVLPDEFDSLRKLATHKDEPPRPPYANDAPLVLPPGIAALMFGFPVKVVSVLSPPAPLEPTWLVSGEPYKH